MSEGFSRRRFLGGLGTAAGASALALGAPEAQAIGLERPQEEPAKPPLQAATVPFDGAHQAGIATPAQANLWLIAFNVKKGVDRNRLQNLGDDCKTSHHYCLVCARLRIGLMVTSTP